MKNARLATGLMFLLVMASGAVAAESKPYVATRIISMEQANAVALAAANACRGEGYQVAVAVTDRTGQLIAFLRDPLAGPHTVAIAQRKAYSAATYQTATSQLADRAELSATPGVFLVGGGVPISIGGHFYGAVGVSGAPRRERAGDEDEACAQAGINAVREILEFAE
jgi:uncharacterized protein GlcG (DUF336 family)